MSIRGKSDMVHVNLAPAMSLLPRLVTLATEHDGFVVCVYNLGPISSAMVGYCKRMSKKASYSNDASCHSGSIMLSLLPLMALCRFNCLISLFLLNMMDLLFCAYNLGPISSAMVGYCKQKSKRASYSTDVPCYSGTITLSLLPP